jgi:epoxyqueuosine reductase
MSLTQDIKAKALELDFDIVGITDAAPIDNKQFKFFTDWLALGYAGRMNYMRENLDKRTNPAKLLENAKSVICVGLNYTPPRSQKQTPELTGPMGKVANYAQYEDYHVFIKKQLYELAEFISSTAGHEHKFKICVDSAPLAERALAVRAGLGFIGKNHILINPGLGTQTLLGEIITTLKLRTDEPTFCHSERSEESIESSAIKCRSCNKCIDACPTGALRADGQFDANKCISYLTIEYNGRILSELAEKIGDRLFGCDKCALACPYQENAPLCKNKQFKFYNDRAKLDLYRILNLTEEGFDAEFADSPIKHAGLDYLKRNAQICLANASC